MERDFESSDEASFEAMFSGVSLQSFLTQKTNLRPFYGDSPIGFPLTSTTTTTNTSSFPFSFFSDEFPALNRSQLGESSASGVGPELKLRKIEPFHPDEFETELTQPEPEPFNFIPIPNSSSSSSPFYHLPDLHSLEHSQAQQVQLFPPPPPPPPEFPSKRFRVDSVSHNQNQNPQTLDSIVQSCAVMPPSKLARRRRQKLSEKTQSLHRLMPWDTKMDIATMLEEAHKYVKFLQAQLKVLQSMPSSPSSSAQNYCLDLGGLGRLTRNQVLQVLVNSRLAQTQLYSKGCCVLSVEQLGLVKNLLFHQQQMVLAPSSSRLFFNPWPTFGVFSRCHVSPTLLFPRLVLDL